MNENNQVDHEFGWDDVIERDSGEFILLPEGDYAFRVANFERGRHPGSAKLPPCNKAVVTIEVASSAGIVTLTDKLYLHTKTEGLLSAFFAAIGQKKKGEKLQMNWSAVIGSQGMLKLGIRNWISKDEKPMQSNEIVKYYPKETPAAPAGYVAGRF